jgi:transcriptional regulator with XRE-family HTH domain
MEHTMSKSHIEKLISNREGMRLYQQERLILDTTEQICEVMEEQGISRTELANQLGKSKAFISQLLNGSHNMTLRTLSDVFVALGLAVHVDAGSLDETVKAPVAFSVDVEKAVWAAQSLWGEREPFEWDSTTPAGCDLEADIAA